jgi:hypothetical protein
MKLMKFFKSFFDATIANQTNLDRFIQSKQVKSVAEIEHWINIYQRQGSVK